MHSIMDGGVVLDMIDKKIENKKDCTGCHACMSICPVDCISMDCDEEGFLYPKVNYEICIGCNRCITVCPVINKPSENDNAEAYACINNDEVTRLESSSGGIFTLVAEQVIDDNGIVFGACFNDEFELEHNLVKTKEELCKLRGSKYVQSRMGDAYNKAKQNLDSGVKVLFTGTPCQIAGLKSYLGKSYENLLTLDIICHGVPSPEVWKKYIEFREIESKSKTQRISFRGKNDGWKRFSVSFLFKNDTEYRDNLNKDLYMRAFLKDICLRPSCYECEFKSLNRQSDMTLADFWGIENILPEMDDDKGTSLVFINSNKGFKMFDSILCRMKVKEVNINEAVKYNLSAIKSVNKNPNRELFFRDLNELEFNELVHKYCTDSLYVRTKNKLKTITIGLLKNMGLLNITKRILGRN